VADSPLGLILDQNIPYPVKAWLAQHLPGIQVSHAFDMKLSRATDQELFSTAQSLPAIIITYDEDFADQRLFPVGSHHGVVRLRVEPTTVEVTTDALERLFRDFSVTELRHNLTIIESDRIRVVQAKRTAH